MAISKQSNRSIFFVAGAILSVFALYAGWFYIANNMPVSSSPEAWGQFGDYVGGILNPIIAFMAFFWLLQSVRIQKVELLETRNELSKQARISLHTTKLSAWSIRLENIMSDISQIREEINYLAPRVDTPWVMLITGELVDRDKAVETLKNLHEQLRLFNEMRETIDREIKKLLALSVGGDF